ncbi:MAG: DUF1080 domain-containing protein [Planctomycetaceae bacterium]|jgi:hypothetical protein|nr:DUF1080 domain-containing protein [Planctomycetaceae bacterium]
MLRNVSTTAVILFCTAALTAYGGQDWKSGIPWQKPAAVVPAQNPAEPPADAVVLFDGKDLNAWDKNSWLIENGELVCNPGKGSLSTKQKFASVQLHIEFAVPKDISGKGQARGNSGVFWGGYEVQVLDSYNEDTYFDGQCGAIYKQCPPLVNVCRKPGEWQSYDIIFNRPELKTENGVVRVIRPAYITVLQNGVLIINHHQIQGTTFFNRPPAYEAHADKMPLMLQDHGNKTRFRNIWVREIPDTDAHPEPVKAAYYE